MGDDLNGKKMLEQLEKEGVETEFVSVEKGKKSNYHYVLLYENERTILIKHETYDRKLPDIDSPKWLYFSSLGPDTEAYHSEIAEYLKSHAEVSLAFQPGTFQLKLGREKLMEIYKRTKIFFCNIEEGEKILGIDTLGVQELLKRLRELGPEIVVITEVTKGAYAYDGSKIYHQL